MEKHPEITLDRIKNFLDELQRNIWLDQRPLTVSVYQCADPIPFADAIQQQYSPVEAGFRWGPVWSTAWFHLQGEYPAEWAGSTVAALIDTGSEALVWQHGAPAQGLDVNRQDFVLEYEAAGAGAIDLYVEAAGNHLFGIGLDGLDDKDGLVKPDKMFILKKARVARLNTPVWDLYQDLRLLFDLAMNLPQDTPRRGKLIYAMNEAVNSCRANGEAGILDARAVLAAEYAKPADASATNVMACGHSHIDVAWLWPLRETKRKASRTFSTVLKYMERYPDYYFTQSQPQLYAYVKENYPELFARIKQAVAAGRWEPEGSMWVEADCNIISGESMVRQILHGKKFFREEFGVENTILWLPDVFGYSAAMPQILKGCNIPYFMTQKISWSQFNKFPHHTFWWEGIDGTKVFTHFLPADTYNGMVTPNEILHGEHNFKDKDRSSDWLYLYGYGDGGGGVTKDMLEAATRLQNVEGLPRMTQGRASDWFPKMAAETRDLRTWVGELYLELHRGTYTTQAKNKRGNRKSEYMLRDAECLAALSPNGLTDYPADTLDEAWKLVLLNQFHDIIPGSSIGWVYEDSDKDYARIHGLAKSVISKGLGTFAGQIDTTNLKKPILVWNTLSFPRSGQVSVPWDGGDAVVALSPRGQATRTQVIDDNGDRKLLVEVPEMPPVGYSTVDLIEGEVPAEVTPVITDVVTADGRVLENDLLRVEFNEFGGVVSYFDKVNGREVIAEGEVGNLLQLFDDTPSEYDAWDVFPYFDEVVTNITTPATITVVEGGPLRATLKVEKQISADSSLVQYIRLEANSRRVDFETLVDWHEHRKMLKVAFPVDVLSPSATYEIQYGHVERPTHANTSWDVARFEVCGHKWADISEGDYGVALLNDCKYGYDVRDNVLRLSLLRSPKEPDPNADMGQHRFTYSLLPHRGDVKNSGVVFAGYDLNVPLLAQPMPVQEGVLSQAHSYLSLDKPNIIIESIKRAEDGDGIIVRLYEAMRRRGTAQLVTNGLCSRVTRTDMLENDQEDLAVQGGAVRFAFRPFEIITLRLR